MTTAPVKSTGGAGFTYEDKVGAFFAVAMLADAHPLRGQPASSRGTVAKIEFQTSADGWLLDDVLLTLDGSHGTWRCAMSIKSGPQFAQGRASADFVERAWRQVLDSSPAPFDPDTDRLALAAPPLSASTRSDLDELQRLALQQEPATLVGRLKTQGYASEAKQRLFASFACPAGVAADTTPTDTVLMLRRILVLAFDWDAFPSASHQRALEWCRSSLVDREQDQAERLWEAVLALVSAARTAGGALTRTDLIAALGSQFELLHRADVSADWAKLQELTAQNVALVSDQLGGSFHLDRPAPVAELGSIIESSRFVAVLGRSGAGKTATTRAWVEGSGLPYVWLRPTDFDAQPGSVNLALPLRHSLLDVLRGSSSSTGYLILDGLDASVDEPVLEKLAVLLRATAFYAGLRNGEAQALRIERIELFPEGHWGLIHVLEGWDKIEGAQDPKSAAGARVVPVCEQLYEILEDYLLRLGRDAGLAFGRSAERPYSYSGVRARAKRAFEKAKLEPSDLQLHECRHSYKSWLEDIGIPDSRIDRYLGHSDGSVQRRYSHQLDHQYLEDAQALTAYLRRALRPTRGDQVRDSRATVRDTA